MQYVRLASWRYCMMGTLIELACMGEMTIISALFASNKIVKTASHKLTARKTCCMHPFPPWTLMSRTSVLFWTMSLRFCVKTWPTCSLVNSANQGHLRATIPHISWRVCLPGNGNRNSGRNSQVSRSLCDLRRNCHSRESELLLALLLTH